MPRVRNAYENWGRSLGGFYWGATLLFTLFVGPMIGVALWGVAPFDSETWNDLGFRLLSRYWSVQVALGLVLLAHLAVGWGLRVSVLRRLRLLALVVGTVLSVIALTWAIPALKQGVPSVGGGATDQEANENVPMVTDRAVFQSGAGLYLFVSWVHFGLAISVGPSLFGRERP